jgi:hypothetical protein
MESKRSSFHILNVTLYDAPIHNDIRAQLYWVELMFQIHYLRAD